MVEQSTFLLSERFSEMAEFIRLGGPSIWALALLSVLTFAVILWKAWRLMLNGAWSGASVTERAITLWQTGAGPEAIALLAKRKGVRARLVRTAMITVQNSPSSDAEAREETERVARLLLSDLRSGLRPLELIATIAPLLGLLGTVLGMISAFQALQEAGSRADPSMLAGGIWEALLTTAAGMAVAIPASVALTWFEAVAERLRLQLEDGATRVFLTAPQDV